MVYHCLRELPSNLKEAACPFLHSLATSICTEELAQHQNKKKYWIYSCMKYFLNLEIYFQKLKS